MIYAHGNVSVQTNAQYTIHQSTHYMCVRYISLCRVHRRQICEDRGAWPSHLPINIQITAVFYGDTAGVPRRSPGGVGGERMARGLRWILCWSGLKHGVVSLPGMRLDVVKQAGSSRKTCDGDKESSESLLCSEVKQFYILANIHEDYVFAE